MRTLGVAQLQKSSRKGDSARFTVEEQYFGLCSCCACLRYAVPVLDTLYLTSIHCACSRYPVLVFNTLCLCTIRCACPEYPVLVLGTLFPCSIGCACLR